MNKMEDEKYTEYNNNNNNTHDNVYEQKLELSPLKISRSDQTIYKLTFDSLKNQSNKRLINGNESDILNDSAFANKKSTLILVNENLQKIDQRNNNNQLSSKLNHRQTKSMTKIQHSSPIVQKMSLTSKFKPEKFIRFPNSSQLPDNSQNGNDDLNKINDESHFNQIENLHYIASFTQSKLTKETEPSIIKVRPPSSKMTVSHFSRPFIRVSAQNFSGFPTNKINKHAMSESQLRQVYNNIFKPHKKPSEFYDEEIEQKTKPVEKPCEQSQSKCIKSNHTESIIESSALVDLHVIHGKHYDSQVTQINHLNDDNNTDNVLITPDNPSKKLEIFDNEENMLENDDYKSNRIKFQLKNSCAFNPIALKRHCNINSHSLTRSNNERCSSKSINYHNSQKNFISKANNKLISSLEITNLQKDHEDTRIVICSVDHNDKKFNDDLNKRHSKAMDRILDAKQKAEIYNDKVIKQFEFEKQNEEEEQNFLELFEELNMHL